MGNLQQQCRGVVNHQLELDSPRAVYFSNEIISGTVSYLKHSNASILLTGVITYNKRKRNGLEKCQIRFFSKEFPLVSSEKFQLQLDDQFPPSFNHADTFPNITYSINLLYKKTKDQIHTSIPIRICPRTHIDRPLLLTPLFFGPIDNQSFGVKLEVKVNRAVFTYDDIIHIFYELQNPNQVAIRKTEISLGIYYLIDSNVWQEDICNGMETFSTELSTNKLIRNKALLNIPHKTYLPPTHQFQYGHDGDLSSFRLKIEYKIQMKIYLGEEESLWEMDIPIVLCNDRIESIEAAVVDEDMQMKTDMIIAPMVDENVNITE